jgi:hypothetical protein
MHLSNDKNDIECVVEREWWKGPSLRCLYDLENKRGIANLLYNVKYSCITAQNLLN